MKRKANKGISFLLAVMLLFGMLPLSALAADDEQVLTSIDHSAAVSAVTVTGFSATLTVPYAYSGSVDLSTGLDINYNTSIYTSASAGFPSGGVAAVGGVPVVMKVTYQKQGDAAFYTTDYTINVVRASTTAPAFSGTISKSLTLPGSLTFTAADFTAQYSKNDGAELGGIVILGSNPSFGSLKIGSQNYTFGEAIPVSILQSGALTFAATGEGTVSYVVRAYALGDSANLIGSAVLTIAVQESTNAGTVLYSTAKNTPFTLSAAGFSSVFAAATGDTLSSVTFTVSSAPTNGRLYYNYRSSTDYDAVVASDTQYFTATSPSLSSITFVPNTDYVGIVTINFTGYNSAGTAFSGALIITIGTMEADVISYTSDKDTPVSFRTADFNSACQKLTGKALSHVVFTLPASTTGTLYFGYNSSSILNSPVLTNTAYYSSATPAISTVAFVPVSGYLGSATVSYTGYNADGTSYAGTVTITFEEADGSHHFHDVGNDLSWAAEAIDYLFEHEIISGVGSGYYNPNASISRGDFILMLCRAFDLSADAKGSFSDVDADSYYSDAIAVAKELKIAKGENGKFNPNSALSRQDAMVLIFRALDAADMTIAEGSELDLQNFTDHKKIADYAADAVAALVKADIIQGYGTKLSPHGSVSRAEMAVILYRILTM